MYSYHELVIDDEGVMSKKFLLQASRRRSSRNSQVILENGILTKLVTLARTRKHNQNPERPTSICSVCSRSPDSSRRCRRWDSRYSNGLPQESHLTSLQPFCEILGSFLCSDCCIERTRRNHLLHLPAVFGVNEYQRGSFQLAKGSFDARAISIDKRVPALPVDDGSAARSNTPNYKNFNEENFNGLRPSRVQMQHLSSMPDLLWERKQRFRQWWCDEAKKKEKQETSAYDLTSTLSSSISSSMARYLLDVSPRKLTRLRKLRAPCNTPSERVEVAGRGGERALDVLALAQRLQSVFRERYLPLGPADRPASPGSGERSSLFDDGTLERLFFEADECFQEPSDEFPYKKLPLSPLKVDVLDSNRIQRQLIDCFGSFEKPNLPISGAETTPSDRAKAERNLDGNVSL